MQSRWSFARSLKRVDLLRFEAFNPLSKGISLLAFTLRSQAPLQNRGASRPPGATNECLERAHGFLSFWSAVYIIREAE